MEERRTTPRIRAYYPVRLHRRQTPQAVETLTKDLSLGGLRCVSPTLFPVSSGVSIELILSNGEEPFTVHGQTRWFRIIPNSDQFDVGIAFLELPAQHKRRLSVYLERLSSKSTPAFV